MHALPRLAFALVVFAHTACGANDDAVTAARTDGCRLAADCREDEACVDGACVVRDVQDGSGETLFGALEGVGPPCGGSAECGDDALCVLGRCVVGCGGITREGVCDGDVLVFCASAGEPEAGVVVVDCGAQGPTGSTSTCADVGAGMKSCAVMPGDVCVSFDEGVLSACRGDDPACVYDETTGVGLCVEGVGRCVPGVQTQCVGDVLVSGGCGDDGQPLGPSCAAEGARCEDAACRGLPQGAVCDEYSWICDVGLKCVSPGAGYLGTCEDACDADTGVCP